MIIVPIPFSVYKKYSKVHIQQFAIEGFDDLNSSVVKESYLCPNAIIIKTNYAISDITNITYIRGLVATFK